MGKNIELTIGKIFLIIGAIIGMHPFLIVLSAPLFLIGMILIISSKILTKQAKIKWITFPLIGILIVWGILILGTEVYYKFN